MKITNYYSKALENMLRNRTKAEDYNFLSEGSTGESSFFFPIDEETLKKDNLFRRYATVINGGRSDGKIVATVSNAKAEVMGEGAQYPEQPDDFKEIRFSSYKIGSLAKIKDHFVRDNSFDVKAYLSNEFSRRFGKEEEYIFLNGNGTTEPTGLLTASEVGATASSLSTAGAFDAITDLYFSVDKEYRGNAVWIMNDETAMKLRKVKDNDGNPLWNHANDTIFGRPVAISPYMEDESKPIIFGDLSFFWVIIRKPLSVMVLVERYADTNDIGYAANERLDSKLVRDDAVRVLSLKAEA